MTISELDYYVPDGSSIEKALARTTHLGIGAHPDDLEIMCYHGIHHCYESENDHFTGIIITDGAGSPRSGSYEKLTNQEMIEIRKEEQKKAAKLGQYSVLIFLNLKSEQVKVPSEQTVRTLTSLIKKTNPKIIYTHNLADKHSTHVAVALRAIEAVKAADLNQLKRFFGCEVWRDLDWLPESKKIRLATSGHYKLAKELIACHQSQIKGAKRYDLGALGRRIANATFSDSHRAGQASSITHALDLMPLIDEPNRNPSEYILELIADFAGQVEDTIAILGSKK